MDKDYKKSFIELGKLDRIPTWRQWNSIAMKKNLLSYSSMKAIAGTNFNLIYRDARFAHKIRKSKKQQESK